MPVIRRAERGDIQSVAALWLQMMREHQSRDSRFELGNDAETAYSQQLGEMMEVPDNAVFVADDNGHLTGYIFAMILPNPPVFSRDRYGFVAEMVVDCDCRRSGTGKELWERAIRWFRRKGVKNVQLNVSPLNEAGLAFWEPLGFRDFLRILWRDLDEGSPS